MTTFRRGALLAAALGCLVAVTVVGNALATHERVSTGTPYRAPLIVAFDDCFAPNTQHVLPLDYDSCQPPARSSPLLTAGSNVGIGSGLVKLKVFCSNAQVPPCPTAGDQEDVSLQIDWNDARCAPGTGGLPGCSAAGADYTGMLIAKSFIRITDHANGGVPGGGTAATCANATGSLPCTPATVETIPFSVPIGPCVVDGNPTGGNCNLLTTLDTLVGASGGMIKESQSAEIAIQDLRIYDAGADGNVGVTPSQPRSCPPACGTFDESPYLEQGVFAP